MLSPFASAQGKLREASLRHRVSVTQGIKWPRRPGYGFLGNFRSEFSDANNFARNCAYLLARVY